MQLLYLVVPIALFGHNICIIWFSIPPRGVQYPPRGSIPLYVAGFVDAYVGRAVPGIGHIQPSTDTHDDRRCYSQHGVWYQPPCIPCYLFCRYVTLLVIVLLTTLLGISLADPVTVGAMPVEYPSASIRASIILHLPTRSWLTAIQWVYNPS